MSWTNAFARFAILAVVIGVVFGMGQAFAKPTDQGVGHSSLNKLIHEHMSDTIKAPREIPQMRPVPTIIPVPDNEKKVQLVEGYTDKLTYAPGDKVTGSIVLKNNGKVVIDDITVQVTAYKQTPLGYVYIGSKTETINKLKITPGMIKKIDRHVTIPAKISKNIVSGDYKLEVTVFSGAVEIGNFTAYVTIK